MSIHSAEQLVLDFLPQSSVVLEISPSQLTSDAGLLPMRWFDEKIGLSEQFAAALTDRRRDPERQKTLVCLMDGEQKLWDLQQEWLGRSVQILDFFHVLKRVREVPKLVEPDFRPRREVWVSEQVQDLLEGRVDVVLARWKRLLKRKPKPWRKTSRETFEAAIGYFTNNRHRMHYHD